MTTTLAQTPFAAFHRDHDAKMVDFAGWEMPLHYGSIRDEHRQVRTSGGIFDVSHMGRFRITGRDARAFLDHVCTRQIHGMQDGQARYSLVCNERGGCRDDVLVYKERDGEYSMVCNASNREKLLGHFDAVRGDFVFQLEDVTTRTAMIALQGPRVMEVIGKYSSAVPELKRYRFLTRNLVGLDAMIARTGYTGEDGVEVIFGTDGMIAKTAIKLMMSNLASADGVLQPAGLGARDSLRLEAGMALYGHEITEEIDPISAQLQFAVKVNKGDDDPEIGSFIGQDAIRKVAETGPARILCGLRLDSPRSARQHMAVLTAGLTAGTNVGEVTSGCLSPTLEQSIAMAYLDTAHADIGTTLQVDLGRQTVDAEVVELPFYKRI